MSVNVSSTKVLTEDTLRRTPRGGGRGEGGTPGNSWWGVPSGYPNPDPFLATTTTVTKTSLKK